MAMILKTILLMNLLMITYMKIVIHLKLIEAIKPILKANFYQNGTIEDIIYPEGVNEELKVNVVNFIEKITPILSAKNYTKIN